MHEYPCEYDGYLQPYVYPCLIIYKGYWQSNRYPLKRMDIHVDVYVLIRRPIEMSSRQMKWY